MFKKNRKIKSKRFLLMWIFVCILAVAIFVSTGFFFRSLNVRLFKERQSHLQEITVKVSEVLNTNINLIQSKAITAKRLIEQVGYMEDSEQVFSVLESLALVTDLNDAQLLALDDMGHYYSSKHYEGRWTTPEDLINDEGTPVIREITVSGEKNTYVVFFGILDKAVKIGDNDSQISHTAVVMPLDAMKEVFTISGFDGNCYTYLVNSDGRRLYKQTFSNDFIEEYNVLTALEKDTFHMGSSIDELKAAVEDREILCVEFASLSAGEDYFVSTVPLSDSDWTVLLFVPKNVIGASTSSFMACVVLYFAGIAGALITIFGFLIYAVSTNKNDRKLLEQQRETNVLLEQAAKEANSANAAKSEFLSHMSHDIRTPINGIVGMTNIAIKNQNDAEKVADCLHKISGSADHLLTLINDVLDMSRIESGKIVIAHEPMDVRTLIDNCSSIIDGQILSRQITFKKEFGEFEYPHVLGDELHLRQVLINILGNSVKFTPDGGTISFRVNELSDSYDKVRYRFEIEDNGIGMSDEFQTRIFEAFSQEDNGSRTNYIGTGLGMAISKQFVDLMGGNISIKSKLNEGSCFDVEIVFDINPDKKEEKAIVANDNISGMRVLLVEDNMLNMEIAQEILEDEGVTVTTAENGQIALDIFTKSEQGTFDVILMDIMMPVLNGFEATKAIRASSHPEAGTIPIIAMTANAYAEDVQSALEAGMNAHIAKPINIPLLVSVLSQYNS
jgi:signal transduction histidine kinase/ActR/RegA family two-component response regulator